MPLVFQVVSAGTTKSSYKSYLSKNIEPARFQLLGLTSHGTDTCTEKEGHGIYTKVSAFIQGSCFSLVVSDHLDQNGSGPKLCARTRVAPLLVLRHSVGCFENIFNSFP